jgi:hypothetical protein
VNKLVPIAFIGFSLTACDERNEAENRQLSSGLKNIANGALKRGCITDAEIAGLKQINGVLEERKSTHRIVMWDLPKRCN